MQKLNLSYFRINIEQNDAFERLCRWLGKEPKESHSVTLSEAVDAATDGDVWKGAAVYMYYNEGWTVFEDLSGHFSFISAESWLSFAAGDDVLVAGYNDAILCAELVIIEKGVVKREFMEIADDPEAFLNKGDEPQAESWLDIASFVDDDDIVYSDTGTLLIF